jgi:hypothetical protein
MAVNRYLLPGRLEDVVLLIQYLAPDDRGQVYDETIRKELGVGPSSPGAEKWAEVARQHPEFFRVSGETDNKAIALLAKFAMRKSETGRPPQELLTALIELAMQLQERQAKAAERRQAYLPLVTALVGAVVAGAFTLLAAMLPRWLG